MRKKNQTKSRYAKAAMEGVIAKWIKTPPTAMYDIGVGIYTEWDTLKKKYPHMEVFGCEPHPEEYEELLPIFPGRLVQVAIDTQSGTSQIYLTAKGVGGSRMGTTFQVGTPTDVETWTLDRFDVWAGEHERILLWIDIEGHELIALKSGIRLLESKRVKWLNIETRNDMPDPGWEDHPKTRDIDSFLAQYEYARVHRYNVQGRYPEAPGDCIYVLEDEK